MFEVMRTNRSAGWRTRSSRNHLGSYIPHHLRGSDEQEGHGIQRYFH